MEISELLKSRDLSKFRVFNNNSLFPLEKEDFIKWLPQMKCPICHRRLYWNLSGDKAFCKSKKRDKFFITAEKLDKFLK